jgi:6-phosphogluconate dehydrogenase
MVHNGIEYADMQLICEAYQLMRDGLGLSNPEMADIYEAWNGGGLKSYLIEITADILRRRERDGAFTLDAILDAAGQKGTGKWTAEAALDRGVPVTVIGEAVFARHLSAMKEERARASALYGGLRARFEGDGRAFVEDLGRALYASKIIAYAQGYMLMAAAARTYGWNLDFGGIALMWRGGCIIRSAFLGKIREAFGREPGLPNLLLDPYFKGELAGLEGGWRRTVSEAVKMGAPVPALSGALCWFDGWRSERLPANLLQAQRDYFGAHGYERADRPRGELYHTEWR